MSLNVRVSTPISSLESFSTLSVKSPPATFSAARVRSWMGEVMARASIRHSSTEMTRPTTSASTMMLMSCALRLSMVALLSTT